MMKSIDVKDWEIGEDGRRFRRVGSSIEHEPEISINGIMTPVSEAEAVRKSMRESEEQRKRERALRISEESKLGSCPFGKGLLARCKTDCAFYADGCMNNTETIGRHCPLTNYKCSEDCMLYQNGCRITKNWRGNK